MVALERDLMSEKSPVEKGTHFEKQTAKMLNKEIKASVVSGHGNSKDMFGLADIVATDPSNGLRLIQVKLNNFDSLAREKYEKRVEKSLAEGTRFEVLVWQTDSYGYSECVQLWVYDWDTQNIELIDEIYAGFDHSFLEDYLSVADNI